MKLYLKLKVLAEGSPAWLKLRKWSYVPHVLCNISCKSKVKVNTQLQEGIWCKHGFPARDLSFLDHRVWAAWGCLDGIYPWMECRVRFSVNLKNWRISPSKNRYSENGLGRRRSPWYMNWSITNALAYPNEKAPPDLVELVLHTENLR